MLLGCGCQEIVTFCGTVGQWTQDVVVYQSDSVGL